MTFNHIETEIFDFSTRYLGRKRFYVKGKKYYPSITTILSSRNTEALDRWYEKMGKDVANYIASQAGERGTRVHKIIEHYLHNFHEATTEEKKRAWEHDKRHFVSYRMFEGMKKYLDRIDNIHLLESPLFSDKYEVAGRVDCIAEYDGVLSVIDFKTSNSLKKEKYNENYYIQGSGYALMFEEMYGKPVEQVVILSVCGADDETGGVAQEFIVNKEDYLPLLSEAIHNFRQKFIAENRAKVE